MSDDSERRSGNQPSISIDYDRPDVEDIMRQVRERAEARTSEPDPEHEAQSGKVPAGKSGAGSPVPSAPPEPMLEPLPLTGIKKLLLKVMRPLAPIIKLLVLPVHRELLETVHHLDFTNRRLDHLNARLEGALDHLGRELYGSTENLNRKVDGFNDAVNRRLEKAFFDLNRTMEYTKLLHSLSHNIVIEMSKLKIEEDGIKVKSRIMEKDLEFLRAKEKALEQRLFK